MTPIQPIVQYGGQKDKTTLHHAKFKDVWRIIGVIFIINVNGKGKINDDVNLMYIVLANKMVFYNCFVVLKCH